MFAYESQVLLTRLILFLELSVVIMLLTLEGLEQRFWSNFNCSFRNIIHGSDSVESAEKEIALWFNDSEVVSWKPTKNQHVYEKN